MDRPVSAVRPVTFDGKGGITFAYSVGVSVKTILEKSSGEHGIVLVLVDTVRVLPGIEANDVDIAFLPGDLIFDDCPFGEPEQDSIRHCMNACGESEYVLIVVILTRNVLTEETREVVHICVASRDLEEGRVRVYDPRNN